MFRPHFFRHWTSIDVKNIPTDLVNWWFYPNFDDHCYFPVAQKLEIWWNPFWLRLTSQDTWQTMSLIIKPNLLTSLAHGDFSGGAVLVDSFCRAGGSCEPRKRAVNGDLTCLEEEAFCSRLLVFLFTVHFSNVQEGSLFWYIQKLLRFPSTSLRVEEYQSHINGIWKYH